MASDNSDGDDVFLTQSKYSQDTPSTDEACDLYIDMQEQYDENYTYKENQPIGLDPTYEDTPKAIDEDQLCMKFSKTESKKKRKSRIRGIVSEEEIKQKYTRSLAKSTLKKIDWAINLFTTWKNERNELSRFDSSISFIHPTLENMTNDELNFCISRFLCEIKKENGEEYPAQTLYEIVIQFQLFLEQRGRNIHFLNEDCFVQIKNTLDHTMKERAAAGIGLEKKKAAIITTEEEKCMWETGVLGMDNPRRLLDTLIYLIGLNFAFRAGKEHRNLRWENPQLRLVKAENGEECLQYKEDVSKTNQGGLASRKIKQKVVFAYTNKENPDRCIIAFYKEYVKHCPDSKPPQAFYLRPLSSTRGEVWYASSPLGIHQLQGTVGRLCKEAGLDGMRTNHSLRASAATRMYEAGVDEQLITEVTGHRSESVREYKRTNEAMKRQANTIINASKEKIQCVRSALSSMSSESASVAGPYNLTININVKK